MPENLSIDATTVNGVPVHGRCSPLLGAEQTVRQLAICWSPRLPYTSCEFEVHHDGVRGCAQHTLLETSESALAR